MSTFRAFSEMHCSVSHLITKGRHHPLSEKLNWMRVLGKSEDVKLLMFFRPYTRNRYSTICCFFTEGMMLSRIIEWGYYCCHSHTRCYIFNFQNVLFLNGVASLTKRSDAAASFPYYEALVKEGDWRSFKWLSAVLLTLQMVWWWSLCLQFPPQK